MSYRRSGFTLMELLIVIAILALLAAIFIPLLLNPRARALDVAAASCARAVATALEVRRTNAPYDFTVGGTEGAVTQFELGDTSVCHDVLVRQDIQAQAFEVVARHVGGRASVLIRDGTGVDTAPASESDPTDPLPSS